MGTQEGTGKLPVETFIAVRVGIDWRRQVRSHKSNSKWEEPMVREKSSSRSERQRRKEGGCKDFPGEQGGAGRDLGKGPYVSNSVGMEP